MMGFTIVDWLIISFATFRLVRLIVEDEITRPLRDWWFHRNQHSLITEILQCQWCATIWSAALLLFLILFIPIFMPIILVLGVAGLASLLYAWAEQNT
jgi:hypothetical protein